MKEFYKGYSERPSGGRLFQRPNEVKVCKMCGAPVGRNYKSCIECYNTIENLWLLDWKELIERENILLGSDDEKILAEVIIEEIDKHSWTIVDSAMKIVKCKTCGNEHALYELTYILNNINPLSSLGKCKRIYFGYSLIFKIIFINETMTLHNRQVEVT